jgi:catechol 2,3-dioxygenase-like lactoylglutathione lyase family enzyme
MGMTPVIYEDGWLYCVGGRTAIGIMEADEQHRGERFVQTRVGLHHICIRAREREEVDKLYEILLELDAHIVHPPEEGPWAPGYYSLLFEDPDGIRLEINYVPGKGLLADK